MEKILAGVVIGLGFLALLVGVSFLLAWPVMALWNGCLIHAVDGVHQITWLQAWGLEVLMGILFKSTSTSSQKSEK